jgi:hypothetical protein
MYFLPNPNFMKKLLIVFLVLSGFEGIAQSWQSLGTGGLDFPVYDLEVDPVRDELYVGGRFTYAGGIQCNGIAKWDGADWHSLDSGTHSGGNVNTVFYFNNEIYVGGRFDSIGGVAAKNIAKWNHFNWEALGSGFNATVHKIYAFNGEIYAGGNFDSSGSQFIRNIARWDGSAWQSLNSGLYGPVYTMISYGNELVIGGDFTRTDSLLSLGRIVKWDGANWSRMGVGFNSFVRGLYIYNGELYVCGDFYYTVLRYISRWDGSAWQALTYPGVQGSLSPGISDMIEFNGQLHITGDFKLPRHVARYDGNVLDSLDHGLSWAGSSLAVYKGDLIAGGYFAFAGNQVMNTGSVARWVLNTSINKDYKDGRLIYIHTSQNTQGLLIPQWSNGSSAQFNLFDLQGRLVKESDTGHKEHINLSNIPPGIYIYHLRANDQKTVSGKLLIF